MLKESVVLLRDKIFKNAGIQLFTDNALLFDTTAVHNKIVWDDKNELLYAFRPNNSHYNQSQKRMNVDVLEYDVIQYFSANVSRVELETLLNNLKAEGVVNDTVITEILSSYDNLGVIK